MTPSLEEGEGAEPSITFDLVGSGKLPVEVLVAIEEDPPRMGENLKHLVSGFCTGRDIELVDTWYWEKHGYNFHQVILALGKRGTTAFEAYRAAAGIYALCQQYVKHEWSPTMVRSVLRGGRPGLLIGQYESRWLECKASDYDLSSPRGRIELAQDVARLANSEGDGLLVVGLKTKKDQIGDRIVPVHPLPVSPHAARYHKILDQRTYPAIDGLEVEVAPAGHERNGRLVVIYVPRQAEELKPFLVTGAVAHGKVEGAFISIVRRREEHSIPVTPAAIHAALSAGRALLRRGQLPSDIAQRSSD